jgi:AraC-like DNA-binding protein
MGKTQLFSPHPALHSCISYILVIDDTIDPASGSNICYFPPTPHHCIVLYLSGPVKAKKMDEDEFTVRPECVVVGPQVSRISLQINNHHKAVLIGFQPGGLHRLLGIPMHELYDDGFDGEALIGPEVKILIERCSELNHLEDIKNEVDSFLLSKLNSIRDSLPFDFAMQELAQNKGNLSIGDAASLACLSLRQFQRKCYERLGMSPKMYGRIARFSHAYKIFERSSAVNWTTLALTSGYYDQMHFIRDFKQFAGVVPSLMEQELAKAPLRFQADIRV